jgi:hypothetical protein
MNRYLAAIAAMGLLACPGVYADDNFTFAWSGTSTFTPTPGYCAEGQEDPWCEAHVDGWYGGFPISTPGDGIFPTGGDSPDQDVFVVENGKAISYYWSSFSFVLQWDHLDGGTAQNVESDGSGTWVDVGVLELVSSDVPPPAIPEPATTVLVLAGVCVLAGVRRSCSALKERSGATGQ